MTSARTPDNESERSAALERYGLLDTPPEIVFDRIAQAAADLCATPVALISLVDCRRQWFKSSIGLKIRETPRDSALCAHAILEPDGIFEVTDTALDKRFKSNPLVTADPNIRFYAGMPLVTPDGFALGTLCVIDREPRRLSDTQRAALRNLAEIVIAMLEERRRAISQRRSAETTAAGLGDVLEALTNEILMFDEKTLRFMYANRGARENLGYTMEEMRRLTPLDVKPEFSRETFEALIAPLRTNAKRRIDFSTVHRRKDGSTYPIEVHFQRALYESRPVIAAIILDITERTQTEHALTQARLFLESAPDATIVVNPEGIIEIANSQTATLFGYSAQELRGMSVEALVPERFHAAHVAHRERFVAAPTVRGMGADLELYAFTKDGREIPIEVSLSPIQTGDGMLFAAAIRDITARKATENALRESEERYRDLFDNATDLIQSVGPDGSLRYVNAAWRRTLGYDESEIAELSMLDVVHPDDRDHCRQLFDRVTRGEAVHQISTVFVTKAGERIHVEGNASCRIVNGTPVATRAIFHDVTERLKHEAELERSKEIAETATATKSRFLAAASHDLRQPLQSLGMYLKVLNKLVEEPKAIEVCDKMQQSLDVMGELLEALLDISRLDSGSIKPQKIDFHTQTIFDQLAANSEPQARGKNLSLTCVGEDCVVHSDPALLQRIVDNFVGNAIRYTDTGSIEVSCERRSDHARIEVRDTGVGIPASALDSIFEEYFQLDNPVRDRRKGLGLGLSIVRHIARLLGHRLDVRSIPGEGSVFAVEVPLGEILETEAETSLCEERVMQRTSPPVVLLVDDDAAIVDATTMLLSVSGFEVRSALDGASALAQLADGLRPDVLISDFRLPGLNGVELVRRVRKTMTEDVPTVILTGDTSAKEIESANLPNCAVMRKPVDTDKLIAMLESFTAG
ncbi:MAG TPA: PAS domain S-box protein [Gammaproteobacteria bacterium]|nr:PAS domain S-box protein [Gammaproteobacteria bacterium]